MKNVVSKNGVWKTAPLNDTPSSGGDLETDEYVTFTTEDFGTTVTADKTYADLRGIVDNGKRLHARYIFKGSQSQGSQRDYVYNAVMITEGYEGNVFKFTFLNVEQGPASLKVNEIVLNTTDVITKYSYSYTLS